MGRWIRDVDWVKRFAHKPGSHQERLRKKRRARQEGRTTPLESPTEKAPDKKADDSN